MLKLVMCCRARYNRASEAVDDLQTSNSSAVWAATTAECETNLNDCHFSGFKGKGKSRQLPVRFSCCASVHCALLSWLLGI
jgi:hypothetical protein